MTSTVSAVPNGQPLTIAPPTEHRNKDIRGYRYKFGVLGHCNLLAPAARLRRAGRIPGFGRLVAEF